MGDIQKFDQLANLPLKKCSTLPSLNGFNGVRDIPNSMQILEVVPVCQLLSCSRVTLWRIRQSDPTFPRPISLGDKKSIRFVEYEIHEWLRQKMHARTTASLSS